MNYSQFQFRQDDGLTKNTGARCKTERSHRFLQGCGFLSFLLP